MTTALLTYTTSRDTTVRPANGSARVGGSVAMARGIQAMLPHCDRFLPAHNLQSLSDLVGVLSAPDTAPRRPH